MHIKQVIIRGFKTYKDQVSLEDDFSPSVNVVVGFNGSGKSNFFNAILFVISDHYGTLRAEMRKSLLHEGSGPPVLTAFVEIVFDNSDRRMPIDRDEVRVRRTIGAKKDDYSLDGKHATRAEAFNLLESCGFTKSNPYYIVQQGKISELTLMSDRRRLELIKEISGASVYDDRKAESERLLDDLRARRSKTDEVIRSIANRIKNLEEEQRELVEYQKLERQRKCLEYELTDRDFRTAQDKIDALEVEKREVAARLHEAQREAAVFMTKLGDIEAEVQQASEKRLRLVSERDDAERARSARLEDLTRARLELDDERKRAQAGRQAFEAAQAEVKKLEKEAQAVTRELEVAQPKLANEAERRRELVQRKHVAEAQRDQLLAKQGRKTQYTSIQQRNKALVDEITRRRQRRERSSKMLVECEAEARKAEEALRVATQASETRRGEMATLQQEISRGVAPELDRITKDLEQAAEKRRLGLQECEKYRREMEEVERQISQCNNRIEATMPRPMRNALTEVKRWAAREGHQARVHGTLLDNIAVQDVHCRAVENTAGNSIFNLLVADDDIAGQIISLVRKGNLGNIVCTPLNQISQKNRQYPKIQGVKPLVEVIHAKDWALPAVRQVFGKTVICSTLELCDEVSRKHGLDAVTLDGDKVSSRGTLTGGYQDPSRFVRLSFATKLRQANATAASLRPYIDAAEASVHEATARLEALHSERRTLQDARGRKREALAQAAEAAQAADAQVVRCKDVLRRHTERRDELQASLAECDTAIAGMEAEMRTASLGDLVEEEQARLQRLTDAQAALEKELEMCEERCHELQQHLKSREQHLQDFVKKRINELQAQLLRDSQEDHEERLQERSQVAARAEREHHELSRKLQECDVKLGQLDKLLADKKSVQEQLLSEDQGAQAKISQFSGAMDELASKGAALSKKRVEADEKLRNLTVTSTEMPKYKQMNVQQLMKELSKCHRNLQQFEHVNKKAIDHFTTFSDQLRDLQSKQQEADESRVAIEDFMTKVDEQKEETLVNTLTTVNAHFSEIFADLVRGGIGTLRMLQPGDQAEGDDDDAPLQKAKGVRIEVSFTGQQTSFLTMSQLSGGQKTVVAIALVFAIQRLEPAPFYLFDEIDAALDTQYRTAVARLIARDAKNAQMVITTFRPEIIETADKFYRVYQKNRVSQIECVPRAEARRVIEEQTRLERPNE